MKPKPDFNIYIINDNADDESKTGFPLLTTKQTMKQKPDFNIYIINDNADDESKTRFPYLHY
jgi:hypothetical protein